jgi:hypothetical protein
MDEGEKTGLEIAARIRQSSKEGQLASESDLLPDLEGRVASPPAGDSPADPVNRIESVMGRCEDLKAIAAPDGSRRYYSSRFMTLAYATILLQKEGDHKRLMAESIRENSAVYPRPLPVEIFTRPPFSLSPDEIARHLERMAEEEEYRDIASTTTSASRVFLYSTLHLEPDHASMLAEWLDVGQFENP